MANSDSYYIARCLNGHPDDYGYLVERYKRMIIATLKYIKSKCSKAGL